MDDKKQKVLILCSGNSARSQMAEGFLRHMAGERFEVMSAGTEPAAEVNSLAVRVMQEAGIDISGQKPKDLSLYLGKTFIHYLIIVCSRANDVCPRVWPGLLTEENRLYWPVDDPAEEEGPEEERLEAFRAARDEIRQKLASWLDNRAT
ncbi:arsenate reductase ArsC [Prosthecochloris sp. N3]|uniref:Arsenate reductase ArsC n=1 Tax=Prosthecochloris ethylica TaxID=2743976 RepID=A0ABR9XTE6_9CHLB|nr:MULTISPECIES: arsenate reductase ArsC [Prosthecochloris]MEC9486829.1 arsenate reductase ArsC [Prosthecochloris sp.]MBF0585964.1 arsenate reductase ArsC [Prosthecochloris ethylica]MBF0637031.1 arsenate reductase ArsC [Prosthecochloris ethylica]NUK47268.1 arsenate reductase ArsC [Prosthecochloris ethylica]RNA64065.1 arsenate reductase ArsC [Prosthecochloris sp. ZM_2]